MKLRYTSAIALAGEQGPRCLYTIMCLQFALWWHPGKSSKQGEVKVY